MRFHYGKVPEMEGSAVSSDWNLMRMPELRRWQIMVFPIAVANMGLLTVLWLLLTPAKEQLMSIHFPLPITGFLICLIGVLVIHEIVHSIAHPKLGTGRRSIIGLYPEKMLLYCIYNGEVSRIRFLVILLAPFVIISLIPTFLATVLQLYSFWIAYITILNAFVSAGDVFEVAKILKEVPIGGKIHRSGWNYHWTLPE